MSGFRQEELTNLRKGSWSYPFFKGSDSGESSGSNDPFYRNMYNLITRNGVDFTFLFLNNLDIVEAPNIDTSKGIYFDNMYTGCFNLTTVKSINISKSMNAATMFCDCPNLQHISFEGKIMSEMDFSTSPLLTHDSLLNIINALAPKQDNNSEVDERSAQILIHEDTVNIIDGTAIADASNVVLWGWNSYDFYDYYEVTFDGVKYKGEPSYPDDTGCFNYKFTTVDGIEVNVLFKPPSDDMDEAYYKHAYSIQTDSSLDGLHTIEVGLKPYEQGYINLGEANLAKLSEEEKAIMTDKNWQYR